MKNIKSFYLFESDGIEENQLEIIRTAYGKSDSPEDVVVVEKTPKHTHIVITDITLDDATTGTKALEDSMIFYDLEIEVIDVNSKLFKELKALGIEVEADKGIMLKIKTVKTSSN